NPSDNASITTSREQTCSRSAANASSTAASRDQVWSRPKNRDTYKNQPPIDFAIPENRAAMRSALASIRPQLGRHFPLVINGNDVDTPTRGRSMNPADKSQLVGTFALGQLPHVTHAVASAKAALLDWQRLGAAGRA